MCTVIKAWKKIIGLIVAILFALETCVQYFPDVAFAQIPESAVKDTQISQPEKPSDFNLPKEFGIIKAYHQGSSPKTLIYIEDAHESLEAQENIVKIIRHLLEKFEIHTVFEEGYEGKVPTDQYFDIPDAQKKERVSRFFMDHLRLGAAEYAHINRTRKFELIGVENRSLYLENLRQYQRSAPFSPFILKEVGRIEAHLDSMEGKVYSKSFRSWWSLKKRFLSEELPVTEYAVRAMDMAIQISGQKSLDSKTCIKSFRRS